MTSWRLANRAPGWPGGIDGKMQCKERRRRSSRTNQLLRQTVDFYQDTFRMKKFLGAKLKAERRRYEDIANVVFFRIIYYRPESNCVLFHKWTQIYCVQACLQKSKCTILLAICPSVSKWKIKKEHFRFILLCKLIKNYQNWFAKFRYWIRVSNRFWNFFKHVQNHEVVRNMAKGKSNKMVNILINLFLIKKIRLSFIHTKKYSYFLT